MPTQELKADILRLVEASQDDALLRHVRALLATEGQGAWSPNELEPEVRQALEEGLRQLREGQTQLNADVKARAYGRLKDAS